MYRTKVDNSGPTLDKVLVTLFRPSGLQPTAEKKPLWFNDCTTDEQDENIYSEHDHVRCHTSLLDTIGLGSIYSAHLIGYIDDKYCKVCGGKRDSTQYGCNQER